MSSNLSDSFCFHSFNGIIMNFNSLPLSLTLSCSLYLFASQSSSFAQQPTKIAQPKNFSTSIENHTTYQNYQPVACAHSLPLLRLLSLQQIFFSNLGFFFFFYSVCTAFFQGLLNQLEFLKQIYYTHKERKKIGKRFRIRMVNEEMSVCVYKLRLAMLNLCTLCTLTEIIRVQNSNVNIT